MADDNAGRLDAVLNAQKTQAVELIKRTGNKTLLLQFQSAYVGIAIELQRDQHETKRELVGLFSIVSRHLGAPNSYSREQLTEDMYDLAGNMLQNKGANPARVVGLSVFCGGLDVYLAGNRKLKP